MNTAAPPQPLPSPEQIAAGSGSNFTLSFLFLQKNRRRGITHFYAISRLLDDAVDEAATPEEAKRQLEFWKKEIAACYEGEPTHPVARAMRETIREFEIPRRYLELLVEGCEMDLTKNRYADFEELYQYCFRVAGVIGLISMKIFGLDGDQARKAAEELGIALQLTNIIRDIKVDLEKGRIYFPQDEMKRFGITESQLASGRVDPSLASFLASQAVRAQSYFDHAFAKMNSLPRRPLIAAWIMGRVYQRLLTKIRRQKFAIFSKKVKISALSKFQIVVAEGMKALFRGRDLLQKKFV